MGRVGCGGVGDALAAKLRGKGAAVTIARRGESFGEADDGWTANGSDPAELHRLLSETGAPDAIVNLWPATLLFAIIAVMILIIATFNFMLVHAAPGDPAAVIAGSAAEDLPQRLVHQPEDRGPVARPRLPEQVHAPVPWRVVPLAPPTPVDQPR